MSRVWGVLICVFILGTEYSQAHGGKASTPVSKLLRQKAARYSRSCQNALMWGPLAYKQRLIQSPELFNRAAEKAGLSAFAQSQAYPWAGSTGDFYGVLPLPHDPNRVVVLMGDVTGHGPPASKYSIKILELFLSSGFLKNIQSPEQILLKLHDAFAPIFPDAIFATAQALIMNIRTGEVSYAGAGSHEILVLRQDSENQKLLPTSMPIGLMHLNPNYRSQKAGSLRLQAGDFVILTTDGIQEAPMDAAKSITLGSEIDRYLDFFKDHQVSIARDHELKAALAKYLMHLSKDQRDDDRAAIVIQFGDSSTP